MPEPTPPRLALSRITKTYPGTVANDAIDLTVNTGEIHALLGENGAGKSTLVKIIYGVTQPDTGEIRWEGEPVRIASPSFARRLGIGMVFQHFTLFETLTVAENIALGLDRSVDAKGLPERISDVSARYGLKLDPNRHVHGLSVGERQRVEIVRCLLQEPRLLIMDEPTSVLTPQEAQKLFETLEKLASEGVSILFISHKLDEVQSLCDEATILRHGKRIADCQPKSVSAADIARLMVGGDPPALVRGGAVEGERERAPRLLDVRGLSMPTDDPFGIALKDITFDVRAGEVLGIAGVAGNGQSELLAALSGEKRAAGADVIRLAEKAVGRLGPNARRRLGIAFVPEERLGRGAVAEMDLAENGLLTAHGRGLVGSGLLRTGAIGDFARSVIKDYGVVCTGPAAEAQSLSGGNMQKYIIGREILQEPRVLLAAHPTWGVDVGAAASIDQALIDLARSGAGVLVVSEDLDELLAISDRIAVISDGRLSPVISTATADRGKLGEWMTGGFVEKTAGGGNRAA